MNLHHRLGVARPRVVRVVRRDGEECSDRQLLPPGLVELLPGADEEESGEHRDVLARLVEVRGNPVAGRHLESIDEQPFLARITLDDREPGPRKRSGLDPLERLRHREGVRVLLGPQGEREERGEHQDRGYDATHARSSCSLGRLGFDRVSPAACRREQASCPAGAREIPGGCGRRGKVALRRITEPRSTRP